MIKKRHPKIGSEEKIKKRWFQNRVGGKIFKKAVSKSGREEKNNKRGL